MGVVCSVAMNHGTWTMCLCFSYWLKYPQLWPLFPHKPHCYCFLVPLSSPFCCLQCKLLRRVWVFKIWITTFTAPTLFLSLSDGCWNQYLCDQMDQLSHHGLPSLFSYILVYFYSFFFFFAFLFKSGFFVTLLNEPFFFPFFISWPLSTCFLNGIALFHVPGFGNYLRCVLSFNALAQVKFWSRRKYDLSAHFLAISGITLKFSNSSFQKEWVALVMCGVKI